MTTRPGGRIYERFRLLDRGAVDEFLATCTEDMVLTVRGSGPATTTVAKSEFPEWYRSMQALTDTALRLAVRLVYFDGDDVTVVLRHVLQRDGVRYQYESWNLCTFRQGQLAAWSSHPVNLLDYAHAWGIRKVPALQMA